MNWFLYFSSHCEPNNDFNIDLDDWFVSTSTIVLIVAIFVFCSVQFRAYAEIALTFFIYQERIDINVWAYFRSSRNHMWITCCGRSGAVKWPLYILGLSRGYQQWKPNKLTYWVRISKREKTGMLVNKFSFNKRKE